LIKILKNFFESQASKEDIDPSKNLKLLAGIMIEAANTDGVIDNNEINKINSILINTFQEDPDQVKLILDETIKNQNDSKSLFFYTSKINKTYSIEKKLLLLETLWEIILSDGKIHDYESNLIRRLSGLLYISDVDSGNAKKRALNKISGI
tara:strand:- start:3278 stop:3730 length:453 start_codon:yes stop_codon:yes gene_type:complete